MMTNTLDLDPEWGAIDLIEEIEETFDIKIADKDAERCEAVGDLHALIRAYTSGWDSQVGKCPTSMAFYRIRGSLDPDRTARISPRTHLACPDGPSKLFDTLARDTGLRLPQTTLTRIGTIGGILFVASILGVIISLFTGLWIVSGIMAITGMIGIPLMRADRGELPAHVTTVGDLARRTTPLNAKLLRLEGARSPDRWSILVALAAEHGSLAPEHIVPSTVLHKASLKITG